jgi:hypothetical protein
MAQKLAQKTSRKAGWEEEEKLCNRGWLFLAPIWNQLEPVVIMLRKVCRQKCILCFAREPCLGVLSANTLAPMSMREHAAACDVRN